jgi:hypothetical protein
MYLQTCESEKEDLRIEHDLCESQREELAVMSECTDLNQSLEQCI